LDTLVRHEFLDSVVDLAAQGRTVFFSSHQIAEVERVADIVAIMRGGRIIACERLDTMKSATKELTVTSHRRLTELPRLARQILTSRTRGLQWQLTVVDPDQRRLAEIERSPDIVALDVRSLSLEEIFLAYMQSNATIPTEEFGNDAATALPGVSP
jgi:ABC-2 type transport system ATP-binding protein